MFRDVGHRHIDQLRQRHRSSLVNPSTPITGQPGDEDTQVEEWVSPPTSPQVDDHLVRRDAEASTAEAVPATVSAADERDRGPPSPAVPCRKNPVRQCRLQNPPEYKT
ncbi:hypothetical protein JYU34_022406 [Plutella xylostella]|uniref:Uncharacterized protein n=1 Tax=Plutella xylostella TaxID=51655 RepID=A0ABQ7PQV1_PLUXY|nr:hypothetical protein JYU34_022406 [Plutella xylostella]